MFLPVVIYSQNPEKASASRVDLFGLQFGYVNSHYSPIKDHNTINAFLEHPISEKQTIKLQIEYYGKRFTYSPDYHQSGALSDFYLKDWNNISLNAGLLTAVTKQGSIGIGVSAEYFDIKRDVPVFQTEAGGSFRYFYGWKEQHYRIFRPGIFGIGDLNFKLNDYFTFFLEGRLKIVYMGEEFSGNAYNTINTLSAYIGFKVDVK
jgi:hypothetical protein